MARELQYMWPERMYTFLGVKELSNLFISILSISSICIKIYRKCSDKYLKYIVREIALVFKYGDIYVIVSLSEIVL